MALFDDGYAALADIRLAFNAGAEVGCHVFLFSPRTRARAHEWHRVIMVGDLAARLADAGRVSLNSIEARAADEQVLAEFDFDAMDHGSIGVLKVEDAPGLSDWLNAMPQNDWPTRFDGDEGVLEKTRFYAFRLSLPDGRTLRAFRGSRGLNITLRSRHAVAAMFQRDSREMVAVEGTVVSFDQTIDFFEWEGLVFIINLPTFESVTNIRHVTARKADEAVDALQNRFQINDIDGLKAHIAQRTRLGKKLAAAQKHGLVGDIDPAAMVHRIAAKQLDVQCTIEGDEVRFDIDPANRRQVEDFVDLMTDFFLQSPVTSREWEAVVKRPPRARPRNGR